ncbi:MULTISPECIES: phytase [Pseudoalteromonas]|uniref:phytase n=1 Tax=Pseudoalteromonas TaxID=53246 RepID=UPI0002DC50F9|nr:MULTISPECIES: phytase [Pseudoalteromonas]MCF6144740.1 3-phytase [Pseudoalteromonas mariniglutinosa NCIMB 1770]
MPTLKPLAYALSIITFTATLGACSNQNVQPSASEHTALKLNSTPFWQQNNIQGSQAAWLVDDSWLLASESQGLIIVSKNGQHSDIIKSGNFETLSVRTIAENTFLVASIDNEHDHVAIFKLTNTNGNWQLTTHSAIITPQAKPEAVCLFNNLNTGSISAFVADVRGLMTETLVYNFVTGKAPNIAVREFAAVNEAAGCTVNDKNQQLFISEEELGIWQMNANAESTAAKHPVAMVTPFGELASGIGGLTTSADGSLWFTTSNDNSLYRYNTEHNLQQKWQLAGDHSIGSVAVTNDVAGTQAIMYDDETGAYLSSQLVLEPLSSASSSPSSVTKTAHVYANLQTEPVAAFGDAADDPAIWVHPTDTSKSLILGTDKRRGLMVYNLAGEQTQALEVGRVNNVDVRQNRRINNPTNTLIAASNRSENSISLFTVDLQNNVQLLGSVATNLTEIYGLCMYSSHSGNYVFVNDKSGLYQQYKITNQQQKVAGELVREFNLPSQPEGCSSDDKNGELFAGEEDAGIWFISAEPDTKQQPILLQSINEMLIDDVEGMEIYQGTNERLLVVSSQGDNSYVVYRINKGEHHPTLEFTSKFNIIANLAHGIDGVSETDGLTVTAKPLPGYPQGVLIVQDGYNRMPQQPQNFKLVDWRQIQNLK